MARLPYADWASPDTAPIVERIQAERGGRKLNLYAMLLHSPPLADGWRAFFTAIRQQCRLPARYRELAILQIAVLNRADYEFDAHVPFAVQAGLAPAQLEAMRSGLRAADLTAADRAVLDYATTMTRSVDVPEALFDSVRAHFDERETVELTATIAGYNTVSRFLVALQIDHE
jgi:alkylhydroperoxidase family enzyme